MILFYSMHTFSSCNVKHVNVEWISKFSRSGTVLRFMSYVVSPTLGCTPICRALQGVQVVRCGVRLPETELFFDFVGQPASLGFQPKAPAASIERGSSLPMQSAGHGHGLKRPLAMTPCTPEEASEARLIAAALTPMEAPPAKVHRHKPPSSLSLPSALNPLQHNPTGQLESFFPAQGPLVQDSHPFNSKVEGFLARLAALPQSELGFQQVCDAGSAPPQRALPHSWHPASAPPQLGAPLFGFGSTCSNHVLGPRAGFDSSGMVAGADSMSTNEMGHGFLHQGSGGGLGDSFMAAGAAAQGFPGYSMGPWNLKVSKIFTLLVRAQTCGSLPSPLVHGGWRKCVLHTNVDRTPPRQPW